MLGVLKLPPSKRTSSEVSEAYQRQVVPLVPKVADKRTLPSPHLAPEVRLVARAGWLLTVTVKWMVLSQPAALVV